MRNIFLFIRTYFNFLFFLVLQIIALYLLFHYNKFHEAVFMNAANEVTGRFSTRYNNITYYFNLKRTNESLVKENERLHNALISNFIPNDTSAVVVTDSLSADSTGMMRKYEWRAAKVVNKIITFQNNTFTLARGENQGVRKDMGVIGPQGVVGSVINTSPNFAIVMSLLHQQSRVSSMHVKSGKISTVSWDGKSPSYLIMNNIPKNIAVAIGDTVVTSQYASARFPQGIAIGTVNEIVEDKSTNFYTLRLKPATNFNNIEFVSVVANLQKDEQRKLEEETKNKQ